MNELKLRFLLFIATYGAVMNKILQQSNISPFMNNFDQSDILSVPTDYDSLKRAIEASLPNDNDENWPNTKSFPSAQNRPRNPSKERRDLRRSPAFNRPTNNNPGLQPGQQPYQRQSPQDYATYRNRNPASQPQHPRRSMNNQGFRRPYQHPAPAPQNYAPSPNSNQRFRPPYQDPTTNNRNPVPAPDSSYGNPANNNPLFQPQSPNPSNNNRNPFLQLKSQYTNASNPRNGNPALSQLLALNNPPNNPAKPPVDSPPSRGNPFLSPESAIDPPKSEQFQTPNNQPITPLRIRAFLDEIKGAIEKLLQLKTVTATTASTTTSMTQATLNPTSTGPTTEMIGITTDPTTEYTSQTGATATHSFSKLETSTEPSTIIETTVVHSTTPKTTTLPSTTPETTAVPSTTTETSTGYSFTRGPTKGHSTTTETTIGYSSTTDKTPGYSSTTDTNPGYSSATDTTPGYSSTIDTTTEYSSTTDTTTEYSSTTYTTPGHSFTTDTTPLYSSITDTTTSYHSTEENTEHPSTIETSTLDENTPTLTSTSEQTTGYGNEIETSTLGILTSDITPTLSSLASETSIYSTSIPATTEVYTVSGTEPNPLYDVARCKDFMGAVDPDKLQSILAAYETADTLQLPTSALWRCALLQWLRTMRAEEEYYMKLLEMLNQRPSDELMLQPSWLCGNKQFQHDVTPGLSTTYLKSFTESSQLSADDKQRLKPSPPLVRQQNKPNLRTKTTESFQQNTEAIVKTSTVGNPEDSDFQKASLKEKEQENDIPWGFTIPDDSDFHDS